MVTGATSGIPRAVCMLCASRGEPAYRGLKDRLYAAAGEWDLRRCTNRACGLYWLDPVPGPEENLQAYNGYFTHTRASRVAEPTSGGESLLGRWYRIALNSTATAAARQAARDAYLAGAQPGRLLEVGCGDGSLLLHMQSQGWKVEGQDIDPDAGVHSLEDGSIRVHKAPLEELHLPEGSYDAIVMNHVIEHAANPRRLLRECRRLLAREGQLILVTPNSLSFGHLLFCANWMHLDPPRHLFLYSVRNLPALVRSAGYTRIDAWTCAAHAGSVGVVSWDVFRRARHAAQIAPTGVPKLIGAAFQLAAALAIKVRPGCGEEVILRARK